MGMLQKRAIRRPSLLLPKNKWNRRWMWLQLGLLFYFLSEKGFQMMPSFSFSFSGADVLQQQGSFAGGVLGDTQARTRTKTSIVAIIRGSDIIASPTPDTPLKGGDTIIAVGTRAGLESLARLLDRGAE